MDNVFSFKNERDIQLREPQNLFLFTPFAGTWTTLSQYRNTGIKKEQIGIITYSIRHSLPYGTTITRSITDYPV